MNFPLLDTKNLSLAFSLLLSNSTLVCFWGSSENVFDVIQRRFCSDNTCMFSQTGDFILSPECRNIVFLDTTTVQMTRVISNLTNLSWLFNLFILNFQTSLDISDLYNHIPLFGSANVFASDHRGQKYILSPSVHKSRFFKKVFDESKIHEKVTDFQGRLIPVAIFQREPWIITKKKNNKILLDGFEVNFFKELSEKLNFTWEPAPLKWCGKSEFSLKYYKEWNEVGLAGSWGDVKPNGTWECGAGLALDEGTAEISFGNFWFRIPFLDKREIGPCLTDIDRVYMVRRPEILHDRWETLHKLLSRSTWATFFVAFIVTAFVYWLTSNTQVYQHYNKRISLIESIFTLFGLVTMLGGSDTRPHTRPILTWWSLFSLLITTAITSSIVTRLTLPVFSPRMDTFQQLVQNGHYIVANADYKADFIIAKIFKDTNRPWHFHFIKTGIALNLTDIISRVNYDPKVTIVAARIGPDIAVPFFVGRMIGEEMISKYRLTQEYFERQFTAIIFRKNSPVFPVLSAAIQHLIEAGFWEYHKREVVLRWATPAMRKLVIEEDHPQLQQPENFSMFKLKPIFYIHLAGLSLAVAVFLFELLCYHVTNRRRRR